MVGWRYGDHAPRELSDEIEWKINLFFISTFLTWILWIVLFILFNFGKFLTKRFFVAVSDVFKQPRLKGLFCLFSRIF